MLFFSTRVREGLERLERPLPVNARRRHRYEINRASGNKFYLVPRVALTKGASIFLAVDQNYTCIATHPGGGQDE